MIFFILIILISSYQTQNNKLSIYNQFSISKCIFNSIGNLGESGGAIFIQISGKTSNNYINDCYFTNCYANKGGAIYINSQDGTFFIQFCFFQNNTAYIDTSAVYSSSHKITFDKCDFTHNQVNYYLYLHESNSIVIRGGVIHLCKSLLNIKNCLFNNNSVLIASSNNTCHINGGVILLIDSDPNSEINNCTFESNLISSGNSSNSQLHNIYGGVIYPNSLSNIKNCLFKDNHIHIMDSSNSPLSYIYGGVIHFNSFKSTLENCSFEANFISIGSFSKSQLCYVHGGVLHFYYSKPTIKECSYENNIILLGSNSKSQLCYVFGGEILFYHSHSIFENCNFNMNSISILNLSDDHGYIKGGEIYSYESNSTIKNCVYKHKNIIINNYFCIGGAFYLYRSNFAFKKCLFTNISAIRGGAIYIDQSNCTIENCSLIDNNALNGDDLAIYLNDQCKISINNNLFYHQKNEIIDTRIFISISNFKDHNKFVFTYNEIRIKNSDKKFVFGRLNNNNNDFHCIMNNNCIYPYDKYIFKEPNCNIYSNLKNEIQFEKAFEHCILLPSDHFWYEQQSNQFTKSSLFSESNQFMKSPFYNKSDKFSKTSFFTESTHSEMSFFTISNSFNKSEHYVKEPSFFTESTHNEISFFIISNSFNKQEHYVKEPSFFTESTHNEISFFTISNSFNKQEHYVKEPSFIGSSSFSPSNFFKQASKRSRRLNLKLIIGISCGILVALILTIVFIIFIHNRFHGKKQEHFNVFNIETFEYQDSTGEIFGMGL